MIDEVVKSINFYLCRICPGLYLADNSIFLAVATMLAVINITKARDEQGKEIIPDVDYRGFIRYWINGYARVAVTLIIFSHPSPFKCDIRPRSEAAASLVRQTVDIF